MTREEIVKRLDEVETDRFYLAMKGRWSTEDFELNRQLDEEIYKLEKELEKF